MIDRSGKILRKFILARSNWAGPEIVDYLQKL